MPAALDLQPWIQVEAVYLPAKDVGGDFYFCRRVGSGQPVVIGDVSGKGLRAAMLASNLVGALRNEDAGDPGLVISRLNEVVLQAHSGGFVTCLCALFEPGGRLRVANAGHIAPYVDGAELAVENCLPLGIVSEASYVESSFLFGRKGRHAALRWRAGGPGCKGRIAGLRVHGRAHHQTCSGDRRRCTEVGPGR
jgi:serine phosphatase RsbU (regulator of sigma subunit)